jgi:N utilization substance protein B
MQASSLRRGIMGFMSRSRQREEVFKLIFQIESIEEKDIDKHFNNYLSEIADLSDEGKEEILARAKSTLSYVNEIDDLINKKTTGWKTGRMNKVDLAILRLGVYEIWYDEEIPASVAINEGVELAKKYSGSDGPSFVNSILAKFTEKN